MEEIIVGVVGVLQFDVLKFRLENEYNVEIRLENLPYEHIRWIENKDIDLDHLSGTSDMKKIKDLKGNPLLLFVNAWSVGMTLDRNEGLVLSELDVYKRQVLSIFFTADGVVAPVLSAHSWNSGRCTGAGD